MSHEPSSETEPHQPPGPGPSGVVGDFRIVGEIGRGGMGVVYEAEQLSLQRRVALKILPAHVSLDPRAIERFKREAKTAAKLRHPGIVEVFAVGESDQHHYFAMELVEGASLDAVIGRMRVPGATAGLGFRSIADRAYIEMAVKLVANVADALEHAHSHGVIHRDVKPSNILVREDGLPVLTDFGLAREAGLPSVSRTGEFAGTPYYVSPEQAMARRVPVDHRTDVFSLGVTLYELLTLERPFPGDSSHEVLNRIVMKEPHDPQRINPHLAADLVTVVLKALEKDPDRRYASAGAFAADLRAFLDYRPVAARRASAATRVHRWIHREPAKAALVGVLVLLVPLVAGLSGFMVAKAPALRAAAEQRRREQVERALEEGFLSIGQHDDGKAVHSFERALELEPGNTEAIAGIALASTWAGKAADALARLDALQPTARHPASLDRVRVDALRVAKREAEAKELEAKLAPPEEAIDLFLEGLLQSERVVTTVIRDPALADSALSLLRRACLQTPTARALYHFWLAVAASDAKDAAAATEVADALVELWPDSSFAWFYAGYALGGVDPPRAMDAYRRAIELDPGHVVAHGNLANLLRQAGDDAGAIAEYEKALALQPDFAYAHYGVGLTHASKGRFVESEAPLRRAVEIDPDFGVAHGDLGLSLFKQFDIEGAIAEYRRALEIQPDNWVALSNLGLALLTRNDFAGALDSCQRAVELAPQESIAHDSLGMVLCFAGDPSAAIAAHRRAIDLEPGLALAHDNLGNALRASGDPGAALPEHHRAIELDPANAYFHVNLGRALEELGDQAGAIAAARRAVEIAPKDANIHRLLADRLHRAGDFRGEREALEAWTAHCPEDAFGWNSLAWRLVDPELDPPQRDPDAGLVAAKRAAELSDESDPAILDTLAEAYFAGGEREQAIATETRALQLLNELDPDSELADPELRAALEASLARFRSDPDKKAGG